MEYPGKQGNQNKKNVIEIDCGDEGGNVELADAEVGLKKKNTNMHEGGIVIEEQEKEYSGFEMRVFTDLCALYLVQQQVIRALDLFDLCNSFLLFYRNKINN